MSTSASVSPSAAVRWEAPFTSEDLFCSRLVSTRGLCSCLKPQTAAATVQLVSVNSVLEF